MAVSLPNHEIIFSGKKQRGETGENCKGCVMTYISQHKPSLQAMECNMQTECSECGIMGFKNHPWSTTIFHNSDCDAVNLEEDQWPVATNPLKLRKSLVG